MQYLYIIKCNDFYKIGIANDVEARLAQLSTGNPYTLEVVVVYDFENAEVVERAIHQKYKNLRQRGEWFSLSYNDLSDIHKICFMLGASAHEYTGESLTEETIEDAEDSGSFQPTIEDVKRIMSDGKYNLEPRYDLNGIRGYFWRSRRAGIDSTLYVGKRNPIFAEVKKMVEAI